MLLLALDTSTAAVTVAVHDGSTVLARASHLDARRHAELLAPQVAQVLAGCGASVADLTDIAVGVGPGPFTGLRVGIATALVLGWAGHVPVHGVCSLDAVAEGVARASGAASPSELVVATDARRREVYWARYRRIGGRAADGGAADGVAYARLTPPGVDAAADVVRDGAPVAGRGAVLYPDALGPALEPLEVGADDLAAVAVRALALRAAGGVDPGGIDPGGVEAVLLPLEPLYLRRPDAVEPGARKRVLR